MAPHERTLTLNQRQVRYWEDGAQNVRVILLLHGGLGDASLTWGSVIGALSDEYRVIAPDLPGFGGSEKLDQPGVRHLVDWIKALMDALEIVDAVVVGHAFGGLFARLFAGAYPQYVPAVLIVNGGTIPSIPPLFAALARVPVIGGLLFNGIGRSASSRQTLERMISVKTVLTENFLRNAASNAASFSRLMQEIAAYGVPEKRIPRVPTLLLWGVEDQEVPLEEARNIKNQIPGAKLNEIESCGHFPQLEVPEVFAWQVKHFLNELSRPSRPRKNPGAGPLPDLPE